MITVLAIALSVVAYYAASGWKSFGFYAQRYGHVHPAQTAETGAVALGLMAASLAEIAPLRAALCVLGGVLVGNVLFQGIINRAGGRPFVDPGEKPTWDLWGLAIPKALTGSLPGRWRWLQLALGLGLIVLSSTNVVL